MFFKSRKQKEIDALKAQITELEGKLSRSQSAYIQASLAGREPDEEDMKYHEKYLSEIAALREKIRALEQ